MRQPLEWGTTERLPIATDTVTIASLTAYIRDADAAATAATAAAAAVTSAADSIDATKAAAAQARAAAAAIEYRLDGIPGAPSQGVWEVMWAAKDAAAAAREAADIAGAAARLGS